MTVGIIVGVVFFLVMDIAVAVSMTRTGAAGSADQPEEKEEK